MNHTENIKAQIEYMRYQEFDYILMFWDNRAYLLNNVLNLQAEDILDFSGNSDMKQLLIEPNTFNSMLMRYDVGLLVVGDDVDVTLAHVKFYFVDSKEEAIAKVENLRLLG